MKDFYDLADNVDALAGRMLARLDKLPRAKRDAVRILARVLLATANELRRTLA